MYHKRIRISNPEHTEITKDIQNMKLTSKEEEIMTIFWEHGNMFIRDILTYIPDPKPSYNTVATQVKFLEDKGFLTRKPIANTYLYEPTESIRRMRSFVEPSG